LLYSSYLGGAFSDEALGIAVDEAGNIYLAGRTESADFPTRNGFQMLLNGSDDAFALKLNAEGTLAWSTFLGGGENYPDYFNEGARPLPGTGLATFISPGTPGAPIFPL
jgi:hypothetical protein